MSQGQWLVKSGGKKVQAPSLGLKISIPKFDNSNLIAEYSKTVIGRCMNPSKQVMKALLYHLPKIWNVDERVAGADLGMGRFQFDFDQEEDIVEVMKNKPFHFDNWMLSIVRWEPVVEENYPSKITFWVRIMGVPLHFWAAPTFKSIGEALGVVRGDEDVDIDEGKVRVIIDAFKPLVFSVTAEFHSGEESIIALRYEKLHGFCRICSSLRHDQTKCPTVMKSTEEEKAAQPPRTDQNQDPSMLNYKGAVESQGRVSGGAVDGNNRRNGQQVPRNNEYKGKGIAYDNNSYDGFKKPGFKRSYGDQDGAQSRNMRQSGRLSHTEAPAGYAMATSGLSKLDSQDVGQHLDHQQKLMMDAFRSGKSGERNQSSVSKSRKALTFEGNSSGMALKGLEAVVEAKMVGGDMEREGKEEGEKEGLIEEVETEGVVLELTEDVASTEGVEEGGADQLGDVIPTEEDFDVEEENQLMETESQEVRMVNEGKECPVNRKKLGKTSGAVMGGTLKKRLVQSIVSPRKKHTAKQGSKMGEKGALPPKKASVKPDPDQD
ncbi:hypothetical protein YC2023_094535 [Brassica napus]